MKKGYFMVGKAMARMLFRQRRPVIVQTSNMHPANQWQPGVSIPLNVDFDAFVDEYRYYNCDKERGMKVTFYTTN
jgi:hypothetical protein